MMREPHASTQRPRACILAVGTEITTGQITNGNAAWLSEQLTDLGLEVVLHETVPDDRPLILSALKRCEEVGAFLFVTGGLGPTTDDFTREVVAEWMGQPLVFHEPSWQHISHRLSALGVPLVESQRQQCLYPEGSDVFTNDVGTANGFFRTKTKGCLTWILPGPPREIAWLWESGGVRDHLKARVPFSEPVRLFRWQCLGRSEAELGEACERALKGTGLQTGYRFQRPYVEVKVWCPESRITEAMPAFARLEEALGASVITRDGKDIIDELLHGLSLTDEIEIFDAATAGILAERLGKPLREPKYAALAHAVALNTEWVSPEAPREWVEGLLGSSEHTDHTLVLAVGGFTESGEWAVGIRLGDRVQHETLMLPYRNSRKPEMLERVRRYATEVAIQRWTQWLKQRVH